MSTGLVARYLIQAQALFGIAHQNVILAGGVFYNFKIKGQRLVLEGKVARHTPVFRSEYSSLRGEHPAIRAAEIKTAAIRFIKTSGFTCGKTQKCEK